MLKSIHGLILKDENEEGESDEHHTNAHNCQVDVFVILAVRLLNALMLDKKVRFFNAPIVESLIRLIHGSFNIIGAKYTFIGADASLELSCDSIIIKEIAALVVLEVFTYLTIILNHFIIFIF